MKERNHRPINLGIFAHVDAGKTTITENILYNAGVINSVGRVDSGTTQTDSMELERRRGISIKSSTTSLHINEIKVNLVDTPGHIDFIAEVERVLNVLDCAILVISGKEGIQSQTKVLWKALRNLNMPTIIFINKLDRVGTNLDEVVSKIRSQLSSNILLMQGCTNEGTSDLTIKSLNSNDTIEVLAELDEEILANFISGEHIDSNKIVEKITEYSQKAQCYPTYLGSALLGIGVSELLEGVTNHFLVKKETETDELSGLVFKIDTDNDNSKIAYVRIFGGAILNRSEVHVSTKDIVLKGKNLKVFNNGKLVRVDAVYQGDIAIVYGFEDIEIGDIIGKKTDKIRTYKIPMTTLCSKVMPKSKADLPTLVRVLTELSLQDPLLDFKINPLNNELSVNIIGQIQIEVIKSLLLENHDVDVELLTPEVIYKERPNKIGSSLIKFKDDHPYPAQIELKIEPLPIGSGIKYKSNVSFGYITSPLQKAVEDGVISAAKEGLFGWEVTDCLVTFTSAYFNSVDSTAAAFRKLTPIVFMEALIDAGTSILEPRYKFELTLNKDHIGKAMYDLQSMRAEVKEQNFNNEDVIIKGTVPVATSSDYNIELATYTKGKGVFENEFCGYSQSNGDINKTRERTTVNPIHRGLYIRSI